MATNYNTARMNMSPRVNYGRNAMDTSRPTASQSGNNPGTYSGSTNAAVGGVTSSGFFPSGYVYSSQNSANPTGYFYGNMPQSEQRAAQSNPAGSLNNGNANGRSANRSGGSSSQPLEYRAMQQTGQRRGTNARNNFNGTQSASSQSVQMAAGGNGFDPATGGVQNRTAGTQSVQNPSAGMRNRTGNMQGVQNRATAPQSGGLFGGVGSMVKGILGKDPLGSIGKVVNIMKMLG